MYAWNHHKTVIQIQKKKKTAYQTNLLSFKVPKDTHRWHILEKE